MPIITIVILVNSTQDKTRQDKTRQDKTRQDKRRLGKTRWNIHILVAYNDNDNDNDNDNHYSMNGDGMKIIS